MTALLRLAVFITAVVAMGIAASVIALGRVEGLTAHLSTDSIVVGKFDVLHAEEVQVGALKKAPAVYNITLPNGQWALVGYLTAGSEVYVEEGWIIGLYRAK